MAELVGLTAGIISLAGLFSTCIDALELIKAAEALERDLEILLVKLDIEKARLLSWGNAIGIVRGVDNGRSAILNDQFTEETIRSILENIRLLMTDSQKLRDRYALREIPESSQTIASRRFDFVSRTSLSIFRGSYNRLCNRVAQDRSQVCAVNRVTWAIRDRGKFGNLVKDLRELVDGLVELVPAPVQSAAERILEDDVASLRLSNLRLVEDALRDQERYQSLSDAVSEAIQATELGTIDHWLEAQSPREATQPELNSKNTQEITWQPLCKSICSRYKISNVV